ncbi:fasciclin domain-containing protein [uncultured Planktosalinus sp.]|uniref:fasciclin domain-containing protein n=1 Tax=uncultured Planktosalinus sp. TaxID=1810935 RepID=UPI0030DA8DF7
MNNKILLLLAVLVFSAMSCKNESKQESKKQITLSKEEQIEERQQKLKEREALREKAKSEVNTIMAILMFDDNYSELSSLVVSAELVETLLEEGPFTLFAPNNLAFEKYSDEKLKEVLKPRNRQDLQNLLKYHIVEGTLSTEDIKTQLRQNNNSLSIETLQGENLNFSLTNGNIVLKDANNSTINIIKSDIEATNGIVHAVSKVAETKVKEEEEEK